MRPWTLTGFWVWLIVAAPTRADDLLFKNGQLVDPAARTISAVDVLIRDGKIRSLAKKDQPGFTGRVIDLHNQWILPGLVDAHAHTSWGNVGPWGIRQSISMPAVTRMILYTGVTAVLDLFADERMIFSFRDAYRKNPDGADFFAAGPMVTCTHGHGTEFPIPVRIVDKPADAARVIEDLAQHKPDVIKVIYDHAGNYASLDQPTMAAVIRACRKQHIPTVVHIGNWDDAQGATDAGASAVTHLYVTEIPDTLVKSMKKHGTREIPTMTYQSEMRNAIEDPRWMDSPLLAAVASPELLRASRAYRPTEPYFIEIVDKQRSAHDAYLKSVKKLSDGEVPLMTGTDAGGLIDVFQGFSVHREMQIYVEAGLSTWQALAAGTVNPKRFLKLPSGIGLGQMADFIVLSASPVDAIYNTQKIEWIVHRGNLVDRPALLNTGSRETAISK
jgi:imidazolonepropionase-like amidohydrolase